VRYVGWVLLAIVAGVVDAPRSVCAEEPKDAALVVVVAAASPVQRVTIDELRELYLRRQRLWADGSRAIPINLPPDNPHREVFSRRVLGRSPRDLVSYWNARYFDGITPPAVLPSTSAVRAYLVTEPGAIAYLPAHEVDAECRVVLRITPGAR
jgi:hypothetical protein